MNGLSPLPIDEQIPKILQALEAHRSAVVIAPPGAGKTTRIPPALLNSTFLGSQAVVMLQPRRVAARASAQRIATEQQWRIGEEVGWHIRYENRISPRTRIRVLTEGILAPQIQADPFLEGIGCVILDEFHERSLHTDLALAMLREIQQEVREDLRILVMSATMNPARVASFLGDAPVIESAGRLFPVTIENMVQTDSSPPWEKAAAAFGVIARDPGHVLIFLPGMREIRRTENLLRNKLDSNSEVHILHGSVSSEDQDRALAPTTKRKVILATNIAETSITIEGVRTVIDSGLARVAEHDSRLGIDRLDLKRISLASANQRSGRAGRTASGRCLRLWTRTEEAMMEPFDLPEIHRADLASTLLLLKSQGIKNSSQFLWFDAPKPEQLARAEELLWMLGACEKSGALLPLGRQLATLPLHPRLARLVLAGAAIGLTQEAALLAAALSERDALPGGRRIDRGAAWSGSSDLVDSLESFTQARDSTLDFDTVRHISRVRDDLVRMVPAQLRGKTDNSKDRDEQLRRILLLAFPDRITLRRKNDPERGLMVGGRGITLEPTSVVRSAPLFLSLDPREAEGRNETRVALASAIEPEWFEADFSHLLERRITHRIDEEKGKVLSTRETSILDLVYKEEGLSPRQDPEGAASCLAEFLSPRAEKLVADDPAASTLLARIQFLHRVMPEKELPKITATDILRAAAHGCYSLDEVLKKGLHQALLTLIDWKQQRLLDELAPEAVEVPTGNRIRLDYISGDIPILAVRLQEMFGLAETPRIANGRIAVLLHLLAPNYRAVQITMDLKSFWNSTYAEVRKELRARYPKHSWPDDPWNAPPTARTTRRRPS